MTRGTFNVDRGIFDHPMFADEPFTEREAWQWICATAVWKQKRVRVGRAVIDLDRGQLAFAGRFLAEKWKWSEPRVRRFLKRLEIDAMVTLHATREATHITVCNYDKWQFGRRTGDAQSDAQTDAPATHPRRKEETLKHLNTVDDGGGDAREPLISSEAMALADELCSICGLDPQFVPPSWCGAAVRIEMWFANGWQRSLIIETVRAVMAKKRDGPPGSIQYFEKAIAKSVALAAKPLPKVNLIEGETIDVRRERTQATGGLVQAADRILARMQQFDECPSGGTGGENVVRLLSKG